MNNKNEILTERGIKHQAGLLIIEIAERNEPLLGIERNRSPESAALALIQIVLEEWQSPLKVRLYAINQLSAEFLRPKNHNVISLPVRPIHEPGDICQVPV